MEELEELGVESIHDLPSDFELTEIQRRACATMQTGQPWFSAGLHAEFESLKYPICTAQILVCTGAKFSTAIRI
jgi:hypothetical protein